MRLGDGRVWHVALWFQAVGHLAVGLLFSHPMPVGIGYWFNDFFSTVLFATRHTGVCVLLRQGFYGSQRIMGLRDGSRFLEIRFCQLHVFSGLLNLGVLGRELI